MPTSKQLHDMVKSYVDSGNWGYVYGARGQLFTEAQFNVWKEEALPTSSEKYQNLLVAWSKWKNRTVADCSGIIYKAMRDLGMSVDRFYTNSVPWKGGSPYKVKDYSIPAEQGIVLWKEGHMALYSGSNKTVEAMSSADGVKYGTIGSRFTDWGFIDGITYTTPPPSSGSGTFRPTRTVRHGDSGEDVRQMQLALNTTINAGLQGTGNFLDTTLGKVKEFQTSRKLVVDGICGKNVQRRAKRNNRQTVYAFCCDRCPKWPERLYSQSQ